MLAFAFWKPMQVKHDDTCHMITWFFFIHIYIYRNTDIYAPVWQQPLIFMEIILGKPTQCTKPMGLFSIGTVWLLVSDSFLRAIVSQHGVTICPTSGRLTSISPLCWGKQLNNKCLLYIQSCCISRIFFWLIDTILLVLQQNIFRCVCVSVLRQRVHATIISVRGQKETGPRFLTAQISVRSLYVMLSIHTCA